MGRPKKPEQKPNRADGLYEYKANVGKTVDGKSIRKSFYSSISLADAKQKAENYKINQKAIDIVGRVTQETAPDVTFRVWAIKWLEVYKKPNVSENTYITTYQGTVLNHLIPYFGASQLKNIRQIDVQDFLSKKSAECSDSLLHKIKLCLCGIYETAIENDVCYKNPAKNATYTSRVKKHEKHVYSDGQIMKAKSYFINDFFDVYFLLETGLRRGELLGLMWKDINFTDKTIRIDRSVAEKKGGGIEIRPPKWDSYRTIPVPQKLIELLDKWPRKSIYVFPNVDNNVQEPRQWSRKLERHMKSMVKNCYCMIELTAHELRHTRGTQLRRNGVDIYTIQKLLGHKDINVTAQVYVHDDIETTRKAAGII